VVLEHYQSFRVFEKLINCLPEQGTEVLGKEYSFTKHSVHEEAPLAE
jgi:hypothetical protein